MGTTFYQSTYSAHLSKEHFLNLYQFKYHAVYFKCSSLTYSTALSIIKLKCKVVYKPRALQLNKECSYKPRTFNPSKFKGFSGRY